jgi:hypothetical protein
MISKTTQCCPLSLLLGILVVICSLPLANPAFSLLPFSSVSVLAVDSAGSPASPHPDEGKEARLLSS